MMLYEGSIQLITFVSLALFLWIGALLVIHNELTIGGLVAFNALVLLANTPVSTALTLWDQLQYSSILLARVNDILQHEPEQGSDHSQLRPVPSLEGRIAFHDMGFSYPGAVAAPVLEGITLDVRPGATVAIVGRSGSGKTTLMKCLSGLFEPTSGSITYDGVRPAHARVPPAAQADRTSCSRRTTCSTTRSRATSRSARKSSTWSASRGQRRWRRRTTSSSGCRSATTRRSAKAGCCSGRAARARRDRARDLPAPAGADPRRGDELARHRVKRAVQDNMARLLQGRTSFVIAHRLVHRAQRGFDRRAREGPHRRIGHARAADGQRGALLLPAEPADRGVRGVTARRRRPAPRPSRTHRPRRRRRVRRARRRCGPCGGGTAPPARACARCASATA